MPKSDDALLDAAARVLAGNRSAALAQIAKGAGISRATLHRRYASREELMRAIGVRAIEAVDALLAAAEPGAADLAEGRFDAAAFDAALDTLIDGLAPAIHLYGFAAHDPGVLGDPDLRAATEAQDERAFRFLAHGQHLGRLRSDVPPSWLWYSLWGLLEAASYGVDDGRFGHREVRRLIALTYRSGNGTGEGADAGRFPV
ncbi:TetR/AcrR family transcriptional regulator [Streptomyces sp. NA04227]|uniref:TetR/AcrR family transcriptional regulator n=1 Tax=Streptomyces sp. NA04227 TaxID=2742136 RepID=UPI0015908B62|nr:TetR/AcrR family transcriptional regulator [Streptomyces sp. NA04227]QKW07631.1 TetR/AcrR family transcriptional regulator [Streptomyces sp. NA04227]